MEKASEHLMKLKMLMVDALVLPLFYKQSPETERIIRTRRYGIVGIDISMLEEVNH